jgi:hypothetical protein
MIKWIIWGCCLWLPATHAFSQTQDSVLQVESTFWGIRYLKGRQQLSFKEVGAMLASNPDAYALYKKAKTNYVVGNAVGLAGGALIGYSVGSALTGSSPHWSVAAVGAGILLVAIPFNNGFHRRIRQAADTYNGKTAAGQSASWHIMPHGAGARLVIRF